MEYKTNQYPKFQKAVNYAFLVVFSLMATAAWVGVAISLLGINGRTHSDVSAVPASIVVGLWLLFGVVYLHMLTPDIRVQKDTFQLKSIFYQSHWVRWEDIRFIKKHWQSGKCFSMYGIGVDNIHPIYSVIGFTQLMGDCCFILTSRIRGYTELMQLLKTNRPDLFQE